MLGFDKDSRQKGQESIRAMLVKGDFTSKLAITRLRSNSSNSLANKKQFFIASIFISGSLVWVTYHRNLPC